MRRDCALVGAILLSFFMLGRAQTMGPEERYVEVYYMIQEADKLSAKDLLPQAAAKYDEAQAALKTLQSAYPGWNERVVNFRLNYITSRLAPITAKLAAATPPRTAGTATTNAVANATPPGTEGITVAQMQELTEQIARLTATNVLLQAKLKEAQSVQPAATDPRELAKAQDKIKELEKERDLIKVALDQKKPSESPADQEQKIVAEVKQKLAEQIELAGRLQKENDALKNQLAAFRGTPPGGDLAQELQITKMTLAMLQQTNISLRADVLIKERQVQDLQDKLDDANRQLKKRPAVATGVNRDEIARQLEAAQAKLAVFEAKPVPYTPQELALLKDTDLKVDLTDSTSRQKPPPEPPPGTGPLMKEAERAMISGKYEDAEKKFAEVLRQDPTNVYILANLAAAQMDQNHLEDATKTLEKATAIDRQDSAVLLLVGELNYFQKKYDEAFEALSRSEQLAPDDPRTQFFLGKVLIKRGNRTAAETALRRAIKLRPNWAAAHFDLAFIYATQKPPFIELAQWHYNKSVENGFQPDPEFEKILKEAKAPGTN